MKATRFLTSILTLALAATLPLGVLAADTARTERVPLRDTEPYVSTTYQRFRDIPADHWGKEGISYVVDKGLFNGTGPDTFGPEIPTNRAMLATVLYRFAGKPAVSGTMTFTDAKNGEWYSDAVIWAKQNRIFAPWVMDSPQLWPESPVTRGEFCVMLRKFYEHMGGNPFNDGMNGLGAKFPDMPTDSRAYVVVPAMSWAYTYSILNGTSATTMEPNAPFMRSQFATMLERYDRQFGTGKPRPIADETPTSSVVNDATQNDKLIQLINDYRAENGLPRLAKNDKLMEAAAIRAKEAAFNFSHTRPDGTGSETVLRDVGLTTWGTFCENCHGGLGAINAFNGWKNSSGHNSTMLTPDPVTHIGVGSYTDGTGHSAYVMLFAMDYGY